MDGVRMLEVDKAGGRSARPGWLLAVLLAAAAAAYLGRRRPPAPWMAPQVRTADFVSGIPAARGDLRLVVAVMDIDKTVTGESDKRFLGLDLGTTRVSISVPARIHYAVDLSGQRPVDFRVHAERRELEAVFPPPAVQAVEVLTAGKRVVTEAGWARLKSRSGRAVEDGLERGLYDELRAEAASPAAVEQIKERARPLLRGLVDGYLRRAGALGPGGILSTRIRFKGDEDADRLAMLGDASELR